MSKLAYQCLRFGSIGIINTAIGLLVIYVALYLWADPIAANAIGYIVGLTVSFALNRVWTFNDKARVGKSLPRFVLVVAIAYLCNLCAVIVGIQAFGEHIYLVQLLGIVIYSAVTFWGCRWFVFPHIEPKTNIPT
jgi:putative flippase GtrA